MSKRERRVRAAIGESPTDWDEREYEREAVRICQLYSGIPGIEEPYSGHSLVWRETRYFYVTGRGSQGKSHVVEVFLVDPKGVLEPVLAIHYPRPIQELFPDDCGVLFQGNPWGSVPSMTAGDLATGVVEMKKQRTGKHRKSDSDGTEATD